MKYELTRCDCCGKNHEVTIKLSLPIICDSYKERYLTVKELDICERCANVIKDAYYDEARRNNFTGIRAISYES